MAKYTLLGLVIVIRMRILILGSLTIDYIEDREKPGGPALYCALALEAYGVDYFCYGARPRRYRWQRPHGFFVEGEGPIFVHRYYKDTRLSKLLGRPPMVSSIIGLEEYDAAIISPVFGEFPFQIVDVVLDRLYSAVDLQGFIRIVDDEGNIAYKRMDFLAINALEKARLIHMSGEEHRIQRELPEKPIKVITYGSKGCTLILEHKKYFIPAYSVHGDSTGAGDFFTAILLVRLLETKNPLESTIYATAATSLFIDGTLGRTLGDIDRFSKHEDELNRRINIIADGVKKY